VDVERLRELPELLSLALADVERGVGCVASLQLDRDRLRTRGVGEARELVETRFGLLGGVHTEARPHEQRALADDAEVDLGRGKASPATIEVALTHDVSPPRNPSRSTSTSK